MKRDDQVRALQRELALEREAHRVTTEAAALLVARVMRDEDHEVLARVGSVVALEALRRDHDTRRPEPVSGCPYCQPYIEARTYLGSQEEPVQLHLVMGDGS